MGGGGTEGAGEPRWWLRCPVRMQGVAGGDRGPQEREWVGLERLHARTNKCCDALCACREQGGAEAQGRMEGGRHLGIGTSKLGIAHPGGTCTEQAGDISQTRKQGLSKETISTSS